MPGGIMPPAPAPSGRASARASSARTSGCTAPRACAWWTPRCFRVSRGSSSRARCTWSARRRRTSFSPTRTARPNERSRQEEARTMAYDVPQLLKMTQAQLDDLFTKSAPGEIPDGEAQGTAIIAQGAPYTAEIADLINHFAWQGKVFDAKKGLLKNK